jgi:hypothetical protein
VLASDSSKTRSPDAANAAEFVQMGVLPNLARGEPKMKYCCERMRGNVENTCDDHPNRFDCADCLIDYWPAERRYGLIIHDGGSSVITINFCPWCGTKLSDSELLTT